MGTMEGKGRTNTELHSQRISKDQLLTVGDLEIFKRDILAEIKILLKGNETSNQKKWLKSSEVKKLLGISTGTLQNLRMNGTLSFSKVGGIIYYNNDEIAKLLRDNEQR
jgi:hypothetical protein